MGKLIDFKRRAPIPVPSSYELNKLESHVIRFKIDGQKYFAFRDTRNQWAVCEIRMGIIRESKYVCSVEFLLEQLARATAIELGVFVPYTEEHHQAEHGKGEKE